MASTSTYLNFPGSTEAAFLFYKTVFKTDFAAPIMRMGDIPPSPDRPSMSDADKRLVMHVALPILGGHVLMGTDAVESMGQHLTFGSNVSINLQPDTRAEAERLFAALAHEGKVTMPLTDMFWGDYFGTLIDRFGVQWMINCSEKKSAE